MKKHRLSTDSRGSSSEGNNGAGSPLSLPPVVPSPPGGRGLLPGGNNNGRVSSFSIDSIMSNHSAGSSSGGEQQQRDRLSSIHKPIAIPASPARVQELKRGSPARSLSPNVPTTTSAGSAPSPVHVPITPYGKHIMHKLYGSQSWN